MKRLKKAAACFAAFTAIISAVTATGCDEKKEESMAADVLEPTEAATEKVIEDWPDINEFSAEPNGMLGRAKALRAINDDVVGYIKIDGTAVDYPVVQCEDNEYYMDTDIYGNYLESGSIFMDYRDNFDPDESKQSQQIVLYGHNMLNGTKFASLHKYREDDSFYAESPIIDFNTNYVENKYVIFAYFPTSGEYGESSYGDEFAYWDMENMDEKEFNEFLKVVKERSKISPDIDVKYGDQILTLQTCWMDEDNSRFLVIGRKIRDDESAEDFKKLVNKSDSEDDTSDSESDSQDIDEDLDDGADDADDFDTEE